MEQQFTENEARSTSVSSKNAPVRKTINVPLVWIFVVILVAIVFFFFGTRYEKNHLKTDATANKFARSALGTRGFGGASDLRVFGTVSAISSSSISVDNPRSGSTDTLSITSSTMITSNGQSATASSITTGEVVVITKTSASSSTAASIMVNPSFGGASNNSNSSSSGVSSSGTN